MDKDIANRMDIANTLLRLSLEHNGAILEIATYYAGNIDTKKRAKDCMTMFKKVHATYNEKYIKLIEELERSVSDEPKNTTI